MFRSQPVPEELQNGEGFGYIIAFRPLGAVTWTRAVISTPGLARYVFRNDTIPAFSPFDVKVGAYNNRGEGPFSSIATVFSAEEGKGNGSQWNHVQTAPNLFYSGGTTLNSNDEISWFRHFSPSQAGSFNLILVIVIAEVDYRKS